MLLFDGETILDYQTFSLVYRQSIKTGLTDEPDEIFSWYDTSGFKNNVGFVLNTLAIICTLVYLVL